jgi:hypothetical protein
MPACAGMTLEMKKRLTLSLSKGEALVLILRQAQDEEVSIIQPPRGS